MSSAWGNILKISVFGESHGPAIGVVLDNLPPGAEINTDEILLQMERHSPPDTEKPKILSGIFNGCTTGTPLCAVIENSNISDDRKELRNIPHSGHADYAGIVRYKGFNDPRGEGHFSGRLTAPLCFAGVVCTQILKQLKEYDIIIRAESIGGLVRCKITGLPPGIGSPMFGGVENVISQLVFAIPAVKALEFEDSPIETVTNHHAGILGGITSGMPLIFTTTFKPAHDLNIEGRLDPCVTLRAVPVVEGIAAIAMLDLILEAYGYEFFNP